MAEHWHNSCPSLPKDAANPDFNKDIGRAGVVLAVAAMDAYFTKKFEEIIIPYLKTKGATPELTALLQAAGLDVAQALELVTMARPFRWIKSLIESHLDRYTTQKFESIDSLFKSVGLPKLSEHTSRKAKRTTLKRSIELLVERRHAIVHEGDLNKYGRPSDFKWTEMAKRLADLQLFVDTADSIIDNFAKNLK